jgi:membrane peptidoglycan carboxypeptidase
MPSPLPIIRRRQQRREHRQHSTSRRLLLVVLGAGFVVSVILAGLIFALAGAWSQLTAGLPPPAELAALLNPASGPLLEPTRLYDRTGSHVIAELAPQGIRRQYSPLSQLPRALADATVAAADPTFRSHPGCLPNGQPTLADRLATDLLLWHEPASSRRSLRACLLALQLTHTYGRDQILEWTLNSANYGNQAYGADSGAQLYFGKPASQLDLAESALLAAVSQSPALNPFDAPEAAISAQHELLSRMSILGMITPAEAEKARAETLKIQSVPAPAAQAPAFASLALDQLSSVLPRERIERGGLNITTSLDFDLQREAACLAQVQVGRAAGLDPPTSECPVARDLPALPPADAASKPASGTKASAAVIDPETGQVLALVGDIGSNGTESTTLDQHPAGSLTAPFIYLSSFTHGKGPASLVWDIPGGLAGLPQEIKGPDQDFHGPVRLREAMAGGYLVPAAEELMTLGAESVASTAAPFGLALQPDPADPLALLTGDQPLSPLAVAQAYGVFAADGVLAGQTPEEALGASTVLKVEGADHSLWLDWTTPQKQAVVSGPLSFLVDDILSGTVGSPSARTLAQGLDRPAAAVQGRTLDGNDTWAAGYTPHRSIAVWAGADTPVPAVVSSGLWHALAKAASDGLPPDGWDPPAGVTAVQVCDPSGLLPTPACPSVVREYFLTGNEPTESDNLYAVLPVNRETGFLATVFTPLDLVEQRTYMLFPEAARSWAASAGLQVPPDKYDTIQYTAPGGEVSITSPEMFAEVTGKVAVTGSARGKDFLFYRLQYGQGLNPQEWYQIGEDSTTPVTDGALGEWDTTGLSGLYVLQLQVISIDQTQRTASVVVTVNKPSPTP